MAHGQLDECGSVTTLPDLLQRVGPVMAHMALAPEWRFTACSRQSSEGGNLVAPQPNVSERPVVICVNSTVSVEIDGGRYCPVVHTDDVWTESTQANQ
jgi:hypothetical protein